MSWFGKKKASYQDLVIEVMNEAMAIRIKENEVFENYPINNLEAVIAIFWMVERSLHGLPRTRLEKAGSYLMDELFAWLSDDYSHDEIASLVVPAFKKRIHEYSEAFVLHPGEEPQAALLRTFKLIVENVFGERETHIARIMAAILLWWQPISTEGTRIATLDKKGEVAW